jgi:tetratricopeptide (TPR) repeat protein
MSTYPKFIFILFFSIATTSLCFGQSDETIQAWLDEADSYFLNTEEEKSLDTYLKVLDADPENYEALWNAAIMYTRIGYRSDDTSKKEEYFNKALDLADMAIELYPDKGHSHYARAVALGRMTKLMGNRDRARTAHKMQESIEKAIELIPDEALVWHIYGVWHSEVANVSRVERFAARVISGGVPRGSNEKAEEYILKAIELDPHHVLSRVDLAKHYQQTGQKEKARKTFKEVTEMKPLTKDDPGLIEKAKAMLDDL